MKNLIGITIPVTLFFLSCTHSSSKNISEQLRSNFSAHATKIDSSLLLDSFKVIRIDTLVERLGRIIDDTIYKRELYRVQLQLANAVKEQKKDSIAFYQYEVNYMTPQIDSVTNSISKGDTSNKMGILAICTFQLRKNDKTNKNYVPYFLDRNMKIMNADMIDTIIALSLNRVK